MTRYDFIDCLRKALSAMSDYTIVNENVSYYEDYIDSEIRKGRAEAEILQDLGDPRLLAKTIVETQKFSEEKTVNEYHDEEREFQRGMQSAMPGWFTAVIAIAVVVLFFVLIGTAISALLPVLLPVVLVFLIIKLIRNNHR